MEISAINRRAGELCLDCIRDAAPESEPSIEFTPANSPGALLVTISGTIDGKRLSVANELHPTDWDDLDQGEWLANVFWLGARRAFALSLPDSDDKVGGVPRALRR